MCPRSLFSQPSQPRAEDRFSHARCLRPRGKTRCFSAIRASNRQHVRVSQSGLAVERLASLWLAATRARSSRWLMACHRYRTAVARHSSSRTDDGQRHRIEHRPSLDTPHHRCASNLKHKHGDNHFERGRCRRRPGDHEGEGSTHTHKKIPRNRSTRRIYVRWTLATGGWARKCGGSDDGELNINPPTPFQ